MIKRIVLCADDYGQAPSISRAIRTLINNGRLSATTCMVNTPDWAEHASWLTPFYDQADIGLHLNLTEGKALSAAFIDRYGERLLPMPQLLRNIMLRQLDKQAIAAECEAQLARFTEVLGIPPAFIDVHQQVHQLPMIRQVFVAFYERHLEPHQTYVRLVSGYTQPGTMLGGMKKIVVRTLGTKPLRDLLHRQHIPYRSSFAGILPEDAVTDYRSLFLRCIKEVGEGGVIICHPGWYWNDAADAADKGAKARALQYAYLKNSQFLIDCHNQAITIGRLDETQEVILS